MYLAALWWFCGRFHGYARNSLNTYSKCLAALRTACSAVRLTYSRTTGYNTQGPRPTAAAVLADALVDNYFLVCELRDRGIDLVARAQYRRVGAKYQREQARRRRPCLAASQQAARQDGGVVPQLPQD